jgi:hypothetical protein
MWRAESIEVATTRPDAEADGAVASRPRCRRHHVRGLNPASAPQPPADDRSSVPLPGARLRFRASIDVRTWRPRRPARLCAWINASWNRRPEATFRHFERDQQAGPVISGDSLPGHTRERTFKGPQQRQTDVRVSASGTTVRSYRTRPTQLRLRSDTGRGEHLLRPRLKAGKLGRWNAARHEAVGAGRPSSVRRVLVTCGRPAATATERPGNHFLACRKACSYATSWPGRTPSDATSRTTPDFCGFDGKTLDA